MYTGAEALYSDLGHCGRNNIGDILDLCEDLLIIELFRTGSFPDANLSEEHTPR